MANKTIGDLTEATSVGDDDVFEIETAAGNSRKVKRSNLGGGRKLLATVSTSAGQTAVTLMSSIPQTYKKLTVEVLGGTTGTSTSTSDHICLRFNNDSGSNYKYTGLSTFPTGTGVFGSNGTTSVHAAATSTGVTGQKPTACKFEIPNYAQALGWHSIFIESVFYQGNVGIAQAPGSGIYAPASPAAISRIDAVVSANAFSTGTVIELWGE